MTKVVKIKYHIRNWAEYNRALINRGSLTIWFEDSPEKWLAIKQADKIGCSRTYSDKAILCALVIRAVFHMPLRALRGFLLWAFSMMQLGLPVPCYTRICLRAVNVGQESELVVFESLCLP